MRKRSGIALLRSIAQRSDPSPLSPVLMTRSTSKATGTCVVIWALACVASAKSATAAAGVMRCAGNVSSRALAVAAPAFPGVSVLPTGRGGKSRCLKMRQVRHR